MFCDDAICRWSRETSEGAEPNRLLMCNVTVNLEQVILCVSCPRNREMRRKEKLTSTNRDDYRNLFIRDDLNT